MIKNMGSVDRGIRIAVAVAIAVLTFGGILKGWVAIVLGIVAIAFVLTSFVSTCPMYLPFKFSTRKAKNRA